MLKMQENTLGLYSSLTMQQNAKSYKLKLQLEDIFLM